MSTESARERYLKDVGACILRDRNADYGDPEDNFRDIAAFWSIQFEKKLKMPFSPEDVAIAMDHVKNSRIKTSPDKLDHWIDKGGYAGCGYGIVSRRGEGPAGVASKNPRGEAFKAGDRVLVDCGFEQEQQGTVCWVSIGFVTVVLDGEYGTRQVAPRQLRPLRDAPTFSRGDRVWVDHPIYGRCRGTINGFDEHNKAYCAVSLDVQQGYSIVHEGSLSPLIDEAA